VCDYSCNHGVFEKFREGGWITLSVTGCVIALCLYIKGHYLKVAQKLHRLHITLERMETSFRVISTLGYDGAYGCDTRRRLRRTRNSYRSKYFKNLSGVFKNFVFISVGVVDSGGFKGENTLGALENDTRAMLEKYVKFGENLGIASTYRMAIGTDIVERR
jgi:hypothetical protein